jgi:hypothetical protein
VAERIFTEKELEELGTRALDSLKAAIDAGDKEKAQKKARYMYNTFLTMHDLYVDWVTYMLSYMYRKYGDAVVKDVIDQSYGKIIRPVIKMYDKETSLRQKVMMSIGTYQGHLGGVKIIEDDEKFTFEVNPCGSGQRLARRGGYKPPMDMAKVKDAQLMTFGTKDFPVYCIHCPIHELYAFEETGKPWVFTEPPKDWDKDPCTTYLYKDEKYVPEKYYKRVGVKRPLK